MKINVKNVVWQSKRHQKHLLPPKTKKKKKQVKGMINVGAGL